ncbi:hypothetical protein KO516_14365 [Citreicella sp. C3M06]|uniref:hypothetical protein n=1 Tax=Roseobacteraceae TaxID=2854170 RepID=UPI001C08C09A|nr:MULTISPECIES: hypothetical protein [Roseobacteraceae]MBU2961971.1 hypothetical protein [Citreicella sp. C3M06]MDO6587691.1 hypothetical protein [Salipiger sp. 1_MG-2023]
MPDRIPQLAELWAHIKLWLGLWLTWLSGAAGQVAIAGAAGGAVRWWMEARRRIASGIGSVITGAIFAQYFAPITLAIMNRYIGPLGDGAYATAAFAAGLGGMSIAKIIIAAVEAGAGKLNHEKQD